MDTRCTKRRTKTAETHFPIVDFHHRTWINRGNNGEYVVSPLSARILIIFLQPRPTFPRDISTKEGRWINGCIDSSWGAFVSGP